MATKRRRHTISYKLRVALKQLEGSKTISETLTYRTHVENNFVP